MNRIIIVSILVSFLAFVGYPKEVPREQARKVARTVYFEQVNLIHPTSLADISVTESFVKTDGGTPFYYIFNMMPDGWIAIAADDAVHPVLAYSFEGRYDENIQAPQFTAWMKQYESQIHYAITKNITPFESSRKAWDRYLDSRPSFLVPAVYPTPNLPSSRDRLSPQREGSIRYPVSKDGIEPLITTSWNQSPWYNEMCPADPAGPGGHCVAGCVPVCMAQVMCYFRWPETGTGSYTYTEPNYGVLSADFGATTYRWNEMTNSINQSNLAIAELIYHLGVSCDLQYGPDGSGMYNHKAAFSLRTYFKYAPETQYLYRDSTNLNWDSVLIAHLDRKIPMYYAGWSVPNISGHAFVCDGYQDSSYFHFNFGWGGSSDGYFYTSDITPGGSNFNLAQEVVINCFPDTVNYIWPVQCSGNLEFQIKAGSFEDGSGPIDNYLPTADCSWLIDPQTETDSVTNITLKFDRFVTNPADFVTVYDGGATSDPVLGSYSGETLPPEIISSGNKILITFKATGNTPANGFCATFKANMPVWCSGTTIIKADTAEFSDGSFNFDYYNNTLCKWKVESESGDSLTIHFKSFDTEEGQDFLTIYDLNSGDTLVSLSGHYTSGNLPDSVTSPSGKMFIIFTTNRTVRDKGWEIYYPKKPNIGIEEKNGIKNIQIYPNPASTMITVTFNSDHQGVTILDLQSADSRIVKRNKYMAVPGKNLTSFDISGLPPGMYIIRIHHQHGIQTRKLVIQ